MAYPQIEKRMYPEGVPYSPVGAGQTVVGRLGVAGAPGERVIGAVCRVIKAGTTTAAVSLGKTGAVTAFMTAADVGATVAGQKMVASGADLAGNGTVYTTAINVVADYVDGAVDPIVRFMLLVVQEQDFDDMTEEI